MIDKIDRKILQLVQDNARISNVTMAREVGMAPSGTLERLRKLEEAGVVQGYHARIDPRAVDLGLLAFIFVRSNERAGTVETGERLAQIPEVLEVHHVAGEDCYLVKVRTRDTESLGKLLNSAFAGIGPVLTTRTTIVLGTRKETSQLPLETAQSDEKKAGAQ